MRFMRKPEAKSLSFHAFRYGSLEFFPLQELRMREDGQQIIISGLGGQGVLFVTRLLAEAAVAMGRRIFISETHGMAQRGGNVISHLKVGPKDGEEPIASPLIRPGRADIIFSLHPEAMAAHGHYLGAEGEAFCNSSGPSAAKLHAVDATAVASSLNSPVSANLVLLGFAAASGKLFCGPGAIESILNEYGGKRGEASLMAFMAGKDLFGPE
jgi:indolepyruvate ferredoxin oxidoreductase beta subunit